MKRILPISLVVALLFTSLPAYSGLSFKVTFDLAEADIGDALLLGAAALFFDVDTQINLRYRDELGSSTASISLYYMSGESQQAPEKIIIERKKGAGWGALAKGKVPPGLAKKWGLDPDLLSKNDDRIQRDLTIHFLSSYYQVPQEEIYIWFDKGLSIQDVAVSINLARKVKVSPSLIVEYRSKGQTWSQISAKYNVSLESLKEPVEPSKKYHKPFKSNNGKKPKK